MVVSLTLVNPGIRISRVCHLIVVKSRSTAIKSFLFKSKCQHGGGLIKNLAVVRGGSHHGKQDLIYLVANTVPLLGLRQPTESVILITVHFNGLPCLFWWDGRTAIEIPSRLS